MTGKLFSLILVGLKHIATPPPLDPLSCLMNDKSEPVVKSDRVRTEQAFFVNQVSVKIMKCSSFSSKQVINELILSTTDLALVQAMFNFDRSVSSLVLRVRLLLLW